MNKILVVGSVAYDSIETPKIKKEHLLGGSANYFSLSSSLLASVNVVGVIGDDYKESDLELLKNRGVDLAGLQKVPGKTFHWSGKYEESMNEAITLETHLNVFEKFNPVIPDSYKDSNIVFLANIDPELQLQVLEQVNSPKLVGADTMNYWIQSKKETLLKMISKINILTINETEARMLTDEWNINNAIEKLAEMGPQYIIIKRGEYGFMAYDKSSKEFFVMPAFPVRNLVDPTGAGDTFAGGLFSYLASLKDWSFDDIKRACIHGCIVSSFTVEGMGTEKVKSITLKDIQARTKEYLKIIQVGSSTSSIEDVTSKKLNMLN